MRFRKYEEWGTKRWRGTEEERQPAGVADLHRSAPYSLQLRPHPQADAGTSETDSDAVGVGEAPPETKYRARTAAVLSPARFGGRWLW